MILSIKIVSYTPDGGEYHIAHYRKEFNHPVNANSPEFIEAVYKSAVRISGGYVVVSDLIGGTGYHSYLYTVTQLERLVAAKCPELDKQSNATHNSKITDVRPIRFTSAATKAILDGRKTMMRLLCADQNPCVTTKAPYEVGDILYVKEPWARNTVSQYHAVYKADYDCTVQPYCRWEWNSSASMPKNIARLFIRIRDIRIERLQDITSEEVVKEGITDSPFCFAIEWFRDEWDSVVQEDNCLWKDNPWVWVVDFEKVN